MSVQIECEVCGLVTSVGIGGGNTCNYCSSNSDYNPDSERIVELVNKISEKKTGKECTKEDFEEINPVKHKTFEGNITRISSPNLCQSNPTVGVIVKNGYFDEGEYINIAAKFLEPCDNGFLICL